MASLIDSHTVTHFAVKAAVGPSPKIIQISSPSDSLKKNWDFCVCLRVFHIHKPHIHRFNDAIKDSKPPDQSLLEAQVVTK